jgi:hypothetical protein
MTHITSIATNGKLVVGLGSDNKVYWWNTQDCSWILMDSDLGM